MLEMILAGGFAMYLILICSIIGVGVSLERWQTLRRTEASSAELLYKLSGCIKTGDLRGAIGICAETEGPIAETLGVGLRKLLLLESIGKKPEEIEKGIVEAMEEHAGHVVNFLERNLTTLATVASLAPILGMLGTVTGMIRAFGEAGHSGGMTPEAVATGISEALNCTAGGLLVAAMGTVFYNYFTTRVNRLALQVQAAGTQLVERLLEIRAPQQIKDANARTAASVKA
ncbi:MAG: MotA/TolQ/ExbB proton channel family protein [Planctomycetota bacterium]|nr:MotA/TolQ/ExbB proton channel family protein [Planctomycetota bacterium]